MDLPYYLVALPQLNDEKFSRSVILITHQDKDGAQGLILNCPLASDGNAQAQMVAEVKDSEGETLFEYEELLFDGGPVGADTLFALHGIEAQSDGDTKIADGLYMASNPEAFHKLLESEDYREKRRFYVGATSWAPGQLESELRTSSWMAVPFQKNFVFESFEEGADEETWRDELWMKVLRFGGGDPFRMMGQSTVDLGYN